MGYLFDPDALKLVVDKVQGLDIDDLLDEVVNVCWQHAPGHVQVVPLQWTLMSRRGVLGQLAILHASMNEYLAVFCAPTASAGDLQYPGLVHTWDFVLSGRMTTFEEGELETRVFEASEFSSMLARCRIGVELAADTWILEYGRGQFVSLTGGILNAGTVWPLDVRTNLRLSRQGLAKIVGSLLRRKI